MPTSKPRLLYVSSFMPYPATYGGKLRVGNLIKRLRDAYEIHYLGLAAAEELVPETLAKTERLCASVTAIPHQRNRVRAGVRALLTFRPYELNLFYNADFAQALARLRHALQPDVMWFSRLAAAQYLDDKGRAMTVLDQHDLSSRMWQLMEENAGQLGVRTFASINRRLVERFERSIYRRFDVVISTSERERLLTEAAGLGSAGTVIAAPNGVDTDYFRPVPALPSANCDLVLTGSMDQTRNIDAAVVFANEVFPRLQPSFPDLRFVIVGRNPAAAVSDLQRRRGVVVTGTVADVRPYLGQAAVVVAPYRFGSGMKHKLPIAMAMGKAVVASSNAIQGLDVVDGRHLLVADTPDAAAEQVARLLHQPDLRNALGAAAHEFVCERYSWDAIVAQLLEDLERSLPAGTGGRRPRRAAVDSSNKIGLYT